MNSTDQPKRSVWPTIFAGVVLLAVAYGCAYFATAERLIPPERAFTMARGDEGNARVLYPHAALHTVFAPVHWLDRMIRPNYWAPE